MIPFCNNHKIPIAVKILYQPNIAAKNKPATIRSTTLDQLRMNNTDLISKYAKKTHATDIPIENFIPNKLIAESMSMIPSMKIIMPWIIK
jgi:hypothetical protein